jgi:hypothetical protein
VRHPLFAWRSVFHPKGFVKDGLSAEGGDRSAVVIDKAFWVKKNRLHANNGSIAKSMATRDWIQPICNSH